MRRFAFLPLMLLALPAVAAAGDGPGHAPVVEPSVSLPAQLANSELPSGVSLLRPEVDADGSLLSVRGELSPPDLGPARAADLLRYGFGPAFGWTPDFVATRKASAHRGLTRLRHERFIGEWRVRGDFLQGHLDTRGVLVRAAGHGSPDAALPDGELLTRARALEAATAAAPGPVIEHVVMPTLMEEGGSWVAVWDIVNIVDLGQGFSLGYRTEIDAESGALRRGWWDVEHEDCPANVYEVNRTKSGETSEVDLLDMSDCRNVWSDLFNAFDGDSRQSGNDGRGGFRWDPEEDDRFTFANVYHHAWEAHDWTQNVLEDGSGELSRLDRTAFLVVNAVEGDFNGFVDIETQFNAFFSPWAGGGSWVYFFGAGGTLAPGWFVRNLGHDGMTVNHEFQHGVTYAITEGILGDTWGGSLGEGYSDCLSGMKLDYPFILRDSYPGAEDSWRDGSKLYTYPEDWTGEIHDNGRILWSHCWGVREHLGTDITAMLAHHSRYFLTDRKHDFEAYITGMLESDKGFYDGVHHIPVLEEAERRGLQPVGGYRGSKPTAVIEPGADSLVGDDGTVIHSRKSVAVLRSAIEDDDDDRLRGRRWTVVEVPDGSDLDGLVIYAKKITVGENFEPDVEGFYKFRLEVSDAGYKISGRTSRWIDVRTLDLDGGAGCGGHTAGRAGPWAWALLLLPMLGFRRRK